MSATLDVSKQKSDTFASRLKEDWRQYVIWTKPLRGSP
jgi:hypothetical protein